MKMEQISTAIAGEDEFSRAIPDRDIERAMKNIKKKLNSSNAGEKIVYGTYMMISSISGNRVDTVDVHYLARKAEAAKI